MKNGPSEWKSQFVVQFLGNHRNVYSIQFLFPFLIKNKKKTQSVLYAENIVLKVVKKKFLIKID